MMLIGIIAYHRKILFVYLQSIPKKLEVLLADALKSHHIAYLCDEVLFFIHSPLSWV